MIGADTDLLFTLPQLKKHAEAFKKAGKTVSLFELNSQFGHLGGIFDITQASDTISEFLMD